MNEICECLIAPIYDGGGEWHCPECHSEYDESEFNSKILWLRDREIETLRARVAELEAGAVPNEQGKNRYGVDVAYFRKVINRELNRPLVDFRPDELARVFARLAKTADAGVLSEAEFTEPQPVKVPDDAKLLDMLIETIKSAFPKNPIACEGAIMVPVDEYNRIVDAVNAAQED